MTLKRMWNQLPFFAWLVALWMALWGQFTWLALLTGIAVAVFVTVAFRLPTAELTGRINPFWLVVGIAEFLFDLLVGALQVAWWAVRPGTTPSAIVRAPLRVDDDLIMTHTAVAMSLVPGTTVIEADRTRRILFLHAMGSGDAEGLERARRDVLRWEERIVRAVGSRAEHAVVREKAPVFVDRAPFAPEGGPNDG